MFMLKNVVCIFLILCGTVINLKAEEHTTKAANQSTYDMSELLQSGDQFFGEMSAGLSKVFVKIFKAYGKPNAYILGRETSGAFFGGVTYGKGTLYRKSGKVSSVFWSGPSIGLDVGGHASRLMILVYNLHNIEELWRRYAGISGSAYAVAGAGFNVLQSDDLLLIPVRTGIGARVGVNMEYLKFRAHPTLNPF